MFSIGAWGVAESIGFRGDRRSELPCPGPRRKGAAGDPTICFAKARLLEMESWTLGSAPFRYRSSCKRDAEISPRIVSGGDKGRISRPCELPAWAYRPADIHACGP